MSSPQCPKCQKKMILRKGKFGDFYGCQNYPRCKMTMPVKGVTEKKELRRIKTPSVYNQDIFKWVTDGKGHAVTKATAGSGKTTVQENVIAILIEDLKVPAQDIIYLAFNSHVVKEAVERGMPARSTHSVGFEAIRNYVPNIKVEVDEFKVNDIVKNLIQKTWDEEKWMIASVTQIVSKVKNTLAPTDNATLDKICNKFGIEVNGSSDRIFELARLALDASNKNFKKIDYDDQIYMPVKFKMPVRQYKWVLGDEVQDWNMCQILLIQKLVAPGGRVLAVGDENQSMYGFRGAAMDAMQKIEQAFQAVILPLSISYRNPASHVDLINRVFPHIKHEKSPFAKPGEILEMSEDKMLGRVKDGDLVICRTNAPLVEPVFTLIRQGIKAIIRGKDIGQGLVSLVERFNVKNTDELLEKLEAYRIKEVGKLLKAEKSNQAQSLDDKVKTIFVMSEGCDWTWQITQKINEVFSDKKEGVIFSSIHKAKGLEAENVYFLNPQLCPHPMAKDLESMQQEQNILFVALSRSKHLLAFVGGPAPAAFESQEMWEEEVMPDYKPELDKGKLFDKMEEYSQIAANLESLLDEEEEAHQILEAASVIGQTIEIPKCPF